MYSQVLSKVRGGMSKNVALQSMGKQTTSFNRIKAIYELRHTRREKYRKVSNIAGSSLQSLDQHQVPAHSPNCPSQLLPVTFVLVTTFPIFTFPNLYPFPDSQGMGGGRREKSRGAQPPMPKPSHKSTCTGCKEGRSAVVRNGHVQQALNTGLVSV